MKRLVEVLAVLIVAGVGSLSANTSVCPSIGSATDCGALITINADDSVSISFTGNGVYDSSEDTLIGIVNNGDFTLNSVALSGSSIFGFDADGMCTYFSGTNGTNSCTGAAGGDPNGYGGDLVTFSITDSSNGVVNFVGGVASGSRQYFSLEENISSADNFTFGGVNVSSPEPATLALCGAGLLAVGALRRRRS